MEIKELLPIGTIVRIRDAEPKLMIYGVKQTDEDSNCEYDYLAVLYPEGNIGEEGRFMFNHSDITDILFMGYEDEEREEFLEKLQNFYDAQGK